MNEQQRSDNALRVTRTINARCEAVFDAWLDPEAIGQWFKPDPAMICTVHELDARVGGRYRITMRNPEADQDYTCLGVYRQIDRPHRLVMTWRWESWRESHEDSTLTIDFEPTDRTSGGATQLTLTHSDLPDANAAAEHTEGWIGCLDGLARYFG